MPVALWIVLLHSLGQENWNNVQHNILVMWCHLFWCQCHMMPTVISMEPFHLIDLGDQNEMLYDFFCHIDAISTSISIMWFQWHHQWHDCIFLGKTIEMRSNRTVLVMWCIWWCIGIVWCWWNCQWHNAIYYLKIIRISAASLFVHVMPLAS